MKRLSGLYQQIYAIHNLELADKIASKGKSDQPGVQTHKKNSDANLWELQKILIDKIFCTSSYTTFKVHEPKERNIHRLPYYPDRILHHAVMNILEPILTPTLTSDTYSCIKKRGIHLAFSNLKKALKDQHGTKYCLKLDIKKFYPSIDHDILKGIIRKKIKDADLLWLLDGIIDSATGLPIGNYLSQHFANLYLCNFDHWIKERKGVKYYFRYCDDLVFLSDSKGFLRELLEDIRQYLSVNLKLIIKPNYQIFPVAARGIDFVGYVSYHTHSRLRKSIKKRFAKRVSKTPDPKSFGSYYGWASHTNCRHFLKRLINEKFPRIGNKPYLKEFRRQKHPNRRCARQTDRRIGF